MPWELNDGRPLYLQLADHIKKDILSGMYHPGDKIPSVRELAVLASVNPNTMQKALTELESLGIIYTNSTAGKYITEDINLLQALRKQTANAEIHIFLSHMQQIGFSSDDVLLTLQETLEE